MEEYDLYEDLDCFHEEQNKKSAELLATEEKYNESLNIIKELKIENKNLKKKVDIMEVNFKSLIETVKAEIKRKDDMIQNLRSGSDGGQFRKKKFFTPASNVRQISNKDEQNLETRTNTKSHETSENRNKRMNYDRGESPRRAADYYRSTNKRTENIHHKSLDRRSRSPSKSRTNIKKYDDQNQKITSLHSERIKKNHCYQDKKNTEEHSYIHSSLQGKKGPDKRQNTTNISDEKSCSDISIEKESKNCFKNNFNASVEKSKKSSKDKQIKREKYEHNEEEKFELKKSQRREIVVEKTSGANIAIASKSNGSRIVEDNHLSEKSQKAQKSNKACISTSKSEHVRPEPSNVMSSDKVKSNPSKKFAANSNQKGSDNMANNLPPTPNKVSKMQAKTILSNNIEIKSKISSAVNIKNRKDKNVIYAKDTIPDYTNYCETAAESEKNSSNIESFADIPTEANEIKQPISATKSEAIETKTASSCEMIENIKNEDISESTLDNFKSSDAVASDCSPSEDICENSKANQDAVMSLDKEVSSHSASEVNENKKPIEKIDATFMDEKFKEDSVISPEENVNSEKNCRYVDTKVVSLEPVTSQKEINEDFEANKMLVDCQDTKSQLKSEEKSNNVANKASELNSYEDKCKDTSVEHKISYENSKKKENQEGSKKLKSNSAFCATENAEQQTVPCLVATLLSENTEKGIQKFPKEHEKNITEAPAVDSLPSSNSNLPVTQPRRPGLRARRASSCRTVDYLFTPPTPKRFKCAEGNVKSNFIETFHSNKTVCGSPLAADNSKSEPQKTDMKMQKIYQSTPHRPEMNEVSELLAVEPNVSSSPLAINESNSTNELNKSNSCDQTEIAISKDKIKEMPNGKILNINEKSTPLTLSGSCPVSTHVSDRLLLPPKQQSEVNVNGSVLLPHEVSPITKKISLGSSDYVIEKSTSGVVNMYITRKRNKKKNLSTTATF